MRAKKNFNWAAVRVAEAIGIGLGALALVVALRELPSAGRYLAIQRMAGRRSRSRANLSPSPELPRDAQAPRRASDNDKPQPARRAADASLHPA